MNEMAQFTLKGGVSSGRELSMRMSRCRRGSGGKSKWQRQSNDKCGMAFKPIPGVGGAILLHAYLTAFRRAAEAFGGLSHLLACHTAGVTISVTIGPQTPHTQRNGMQSLVRGYPPGVSSGSLDWRRDSALVQSSGSGLPKPLVGCPQNL
jgi:hypothetical protein